MRIEVTSDAQASAAVQPVRGVERAAVLAAERRESSHGRAAAETRHAGSPAGDEIDPKTAAALKDLGRFMERHDIRLEFRRHEETGVVVLKLIDQKSGETLQQLPSEVSLRLAETFGKLQGGLVSSVA